MWKSGIGSTNRHNMHDSQLTAAQLAATALSLNESERNQYLLACSHGDASLEQQIRLLVAQLLQANQENDVILETVDPLSTIGATAYSRDNDIAATQDDPSFIYDDLEPTLGPASSQLDNTLDPVDDDASGDQPLDTIDSSPYQPDDSQHRFNETIAPEIQTHVKSICHDFSQAWQQGLEPRIEDYLPKDASPSQLEYVAFQLLLVDLEQRRLHDRQLSEDDYINRSPELKDVIKSAITWRSGNKSQQRASSAAVHSKNDHRREPPSASKPIKSASDGSMRYQSLNLHARGGLGAVFRAKDTELGRTVALKRILPDFSNDRASRARFVFEAEVTGSLEHPGIVPVYGLGKTKDGHPYYAMRFIRGKSFSEEIARLHYRDLPSEANAGNKKGIKLGRKPKREKIPVDFYSREFRMLLRRLVDVCNAIQFAHQRGILHRDLKPDNVMLGQYGETLVVDWGLAKIMSPSGNEPTLTEATPETLSLTGSGLHTSIGQAVGTPMYMSSEQALGLHNELTPASDIYSLGAILFHIVSGEHPIAGKSAVEIIGKVRVGETRDLAQVAPTAPKPLVSIVRKALAQSPSDRYQSATELADDVDRWMSDEPVNSHQEHEQLLEKAGRLIRRHRGWTVSGAFALLCITLVSVIAATLIQRAKIAETGAKNREIVARQNEATARDDAIARLRMSRETIDTFLVQSDDALRFFPATESVRRRLLTVAAEDYAKLAKDPSSDPSLELERARTLSRLGDLSQLQEDYTAAIEHYTKAQQVLASRTLSNDFQDLKMQYAIESANTRIRTGIAWVNQNRSSDAMKEYTQARTSLTEMARITDAVDVRRALAVVSTNIGELYAQESRFTEATEELSEAMKWYQTLEGIATAKDNLAAVTTENLLGRIHAKTGSVDSARDFFQRATTRASELVRRSPDNLEYLDSLSSVLVSSTVVERDAGRRDVELTMLREAVSHYRAIVTAMPDVPAYSENLSLTLTDLGLALLESEHCHDGLDVLVEADGIIKGLRARYGTIVRYNDQWAACQDALGQTQRLLGQRESAQASTANAIRTYQSLSEQFPERADYFERLAIAQSHLSGTLIDLPDQADAGFEAAEGTLRQLLIAFPDVTRYSSALGHVCYQRGLMASRNGNVNAATHFREARNFWIKLGETRDSRTTERLAWLLATCPSDDVRDLGEAIRYAGEALQAAPDNSQFRTTVAIARLLHGEVAQAAAVMKQSTTPKSDRNSRELLTLAAIAKAAGETQYVKTLRQEGMKLMQLQAPESDDLKFLASQTEE